MNNVVKLFLSLVIVVIITILIGTWARMWLGNQRQVDTSLNEAISSLSPDIPQELFDVAEEEYAIEFEAEGTAVEIDMRFCELVKKQCEEQGIKNCEDYKMCLEGVGGD